MLPLDHTAAIEHLLPAHRVTVTDLRSGAHYITTHPIVDRYMAIAEALRETEAQRPELAEIGVTHAVTRVEEVKR